MPATIITLREFLFGNITDLSAKTAIGDLTAPQNLASLIVSLAHYHEEGVVLMPEVFLCRSIDAVLQLLPGHEKLKIGEAPTGGEAIPQAVKRCAPIAQGGWCIYVEQPSAGSTHCSFGLFRGSFSPLSVSVNRALFVEPMEEPRLLRLCRTANGCVQLKNHLGQIHQIMLSDKPSESAPSTQDVEKLVSSMCRNVPEVRRDSVKTFLEKSVQSALQASHGAIIAVTTTDRTPSFLLDGVTLEVPLDISAAVARKLGPLADSEADYKLAAARTLLSGMVSSDGITLFSSKAKLIAYNCFIAGPRGAKPVVGGARTRAFEELIKRLGRGIDAVFMQSQDGWVKFGSKHNGK